MEPRIRQIKRIEMKNKKYKIKNKGQALVELLITLPIYIFLLWGIVFFARWLITDIRLQMYARTAVWVCVYDNQPASRMRAKAVELTDQITWGEVVRIEVGEGRGWNPYAGPAFVEIEYRIPVPRILRVGQVIGYAFGSEGWDEWINITARNEVFNNTWMSGPALIPTPNNRSRS